MVWSHTKRRKNTIIPSWVMSIWPPTVALGRKHSSKKLSPCWLWAERCVLLAWAQSRKLYHTYTPHACSQTEKSDPLGHDTPELVERTEAVFQRIKFEELKLKEQVSGLCLLNNQLFDRWPHPRSPHSQPLCQLAFTVFCCVTSNPPNQWLTTHRFVSPSPYMMVSIGQLQLCSTCLLIPRSRLKEQDCQSSMTVMGQRERGRELANRNASSFFF